MGKIRENGYKKLLSGWGIYAVVVSVLMMLFATAFVLVFVRAGYHTKVLVKLGLAEQTTKVNHAVLAWENCLDKMEYDADVVFFGDSITYESDFGRSFPGISVVNLGYSGDTLSGMISRIPMVKAVNPEKVFVLGGINGLTDSNIMQSAEKYEQLILQLRQALPTAQIYLQSVLPVAKDKEVTLTNICHNTTIVQFNVRIRQLAEKYELTYIDLYSLYVADGQLDPLLTTDGIHLQKDAYARWETAIKEYID